MNEPEFRCSDSSRLMLEAVSAGIGYACVLCWPSACFVASFKPNDLGQPYWRGTPNLRTDTCGIIAFGIAAVCLCTSEYFRLRRRRRCPVWISNPVLGDDITLVAVAASGTVAILGTGVFIYLSVNAVTHPETLEMRATHLMTWPTEGTLRVMALLACAVSVVVWRSLLPRSRPDGGGAFAEVRERVSNTTRG